MTEQEIRRDPRFKELQAEAVQAYKAFADAMRQIDKEFPAEAGQHWELRLGPAAGVHLFRHEPIEDEE